MRGKTEGKPVLFLDSSVLIAALLSSWGGSFRICQESHDRKLYLYINNYIKDEVIAVLNRKYPNKVGGFFALLKFAKIKIKSNPNPRLVKRYSNLIHPEDAPILAGAVQVKTDFLVTLDRKDFMTEKIQKAQLSTIIVTPQMFFQEHWTK